MAVKRYVTSRRPRGLTDTEVMVFLGLMIVDSKSRTGIFGAEIGADSVAALGKFKTYLKDAVEGVASDSTGVTGESQVEHWDAIDTEEGNKKNTYGAKIKISTLFKWAAMHRDKLNSLSVTLKAAMEGDADYSQCDKTAPEIMDLIEFARLVTLRKSDEP